MTCIGVEEEHLICKAVDETVEDQQNLLRSLLMSCKRNRGKQMLMIMSQSGCCMWGQIGSLLQSGDLQTNDHEAPSEQPLLLRCWQISNRRNPAVQKRGKSGTALKINQQLATAGIIKYIRMHLKGGHTHPAVSVHKGMNNGAILLALVFNILSNVLVPSWLCFSASKPTQQLGLGS